MSFNRFGELTRIADEVTNNNFGYVPDARPINLLLNYGVILLDKPGGPTSHEVVAWVKRILKLEKAGHSGTLDPGATGLLPIGLGDATKALSVLLLGPKEYYAIARLHSRPDHANITDVLADFTGEIYQRPPQRSSVRRSTRVRTIYELDLVEQDDNNLLLRILCQAGTYVRKLIYDIGEVLGYGATMFELRRTRVSNFHEGTYGLARLHDVVDAFETYKEKGEDKLLRKVVIPVEECLKGISAIVVKDSAVDAICHGAQLAVPGIVALESGLNEQDLVGIYTLKWELIALGTSLMTADVIKENTKGIACSTKRLIMKPGTYPRGWK
ncbi:MAG: RNA-guided pseudouridylation complex pseudouridine synthase subunit Cbf5 [Thermoproteota archaeon]|nr:RNA-guided pseudouridylation complex pseudouridine synthase subunit Cbf5 [Thermoproteota archaeon]